MSKKKVYFTIFFILVLAFFAGNLVYPQFLNLKFIPDMPFKLGLDLQGGTHLVYEADLSKIGGEDHESSMQGLKDVIERRIDFFGVQEPVVQVQEKGDRYRLVVELAGIDDPAEAIKMIGETPYLEFKEQRSGEETELILAKQKEVEGKPMEEAIEIADWQIAFENPYFKATALTGQYLKKAEMGFDQTSYVPLVSLEFDEEGSRIFEELTEKNLGKILAIYIDDMLISAPTVQGKIAGGKAQITGDFTVDEARSLARNLSAGALPVPITLISQQTVGPTLGAISLEKSLKAGALGFLAVVLFMIIFYRIPGFLASIALAIYISLILSVFKLVPVTLTLAGIGGFVLSIGMAVDANVLIFSRMREELAEGKSLGQAIEDGFDRAWSSIRDGNLTTLIVAAILFAFGTSFIKGFALTLSLGILLSMFSAIIISKNFLRVFSGTKLEKIKMLWR
ncbi:MAG: protein translocase subunit SecD [bacterium]|nr:protein translocase subunit SecD [bacterium]